MDRSLFCLFRSFQQQLYRKVVDFSGIRIRIIRVQGEHADHSATTKTLRSGFSSPYIKEFLQGFVGKWKSRLGHVATNYGTLCPLRIGSDTHFGL